MIAYEKAGAKFTVSFSSEGDFLLKTFGVNLIGGFIDNELKYNENVIEEDSLWVNFNTNFMVHLTGVLSFLNRGISKIYHKVKQEFKPIKIPKDKVDEIIEESKNNGKQKIIFGFQKLDKETSDKINTLLDHIFFI